MGPISDVRSSFYQDLCLLCCRFHSWLPARELKTRTPTQATLGGGWMRLACCFDWCCWWGSMSNGSQPGRHGSFVLWSWPYKQPLHARGEWVEMKKCFWIRRFGLLIHSLADCFFFYSLDSGSAVSFFMKAHVKSVDTKTTTGIIVSTEKWFASSDHDNSRIFGTFL